MSIGIEGQGGDSGVEKERESEGRRKETWIGEKEKDDRGRKEGEGDERRGEEKR